MATNINSQEIQINRSANKVVDFLSDLNNYASLMPKEVNMFEVEGDQAMLHVDGLGKFQLVVSEKTADQIVLKPSGKLPFDFDIVWTVTPTAAGSSVLGTIRANLNPFIKLLAEPKLRSFVDAQAVNMQTYLESSIPE